MKVQVQSIHFNADKKLLRFIKRRTDKLDQFFNKIVKGDVYLRLQNSEDEANKVVEIKLSVPGNQLFVKQQRRSFEEAMDLAIDALCRQLNKHKSKGRSYLGAHKEVLAAALI